MITVTSSDCFHSHAFTMWWEEAFDYIESNGFHCLGYPDDGWALDCLVMAYNAGLSSADAVESIIREYDPTP